MTNCDVLVVGAGPAGSVAATVLARAGARVQLVDRASFPRDKLCGDTLNPGTLAVLRRLGLASSIEDRGLPIDGMRLTGENGVVIEGRYPAGMSGRALLRRDFDWTLVCAALSAGAEMHAPLMVRAPIVDDDRIVRGVMVSDARSGDRGERAIRARVTIAADGRHSTLAFALGLARHPAAPRRWAIGTYLADVGGMSSFGEMHVRRGHYIGIAPVPGSVANVCLVKPSEAGDASLRDPSALLRRELARDPLLRDRFEDARLAQPPVVLGPLAVESTGVDLEGLLVAGDASGFVDPMTGDGLRFAIRGGELAAIAALEALEHGWSGVHDRLAGRREREFSGKWRFNRALRTLVGSPPGVMVAAAGARVAPGVLRAIIRRAGDCDLAAACA
jgi:flavin-dependent dehydrogenase